MMEFFRKLKWLVQRRRREDELQEELQFHLAEEAEEQRAAGARRKRRDGRRGVSWEMLVWCRRIRARRGDRR
jgi:hypothetical protein